MTRPQVKRVGEGAVELQADHGDQAGGDDQGQRDDDGATTRRTRPKYEYDHDGQHGPDPEALERSREQVEPNPRERCRVSSVGHGERSHPGGTDDG